MRYLTSIITCLLISSVVSGQDNAGRKDKEDMIGWDLTSTLRDRKISMIFSHSFHDRWTMGWSAGLKFISMPRETDSEENEHYSELDSSEYSNDIDDMFSGSVSVSFWPDGCHKGPFIGMGLSCGDRSGTDIHIEPGYCCRIWNSFAAGISFRINLKEAYSQAKIPTHGLTLSLHYIF